MNTESTTSKPLAVNEVMKINSRHLRGNIAADLADTSTGNISEESNQLSKFHGLYMQDDRDLRNPLKKEGKEKAFAFMLRVRLPGGRATGEQWLVLDRLADEVASPSLRLTTQRDYGDRTNRKHARLKYTIQDRGIDWFRSEVEKRSGIIFTPARPFEFTTIEDPHGWHENADGTWYYGLHILSGRIKDIPGWPMKTALREIAEIHDGEFRLTPSQNVSISGVSAGTKKEISAILQKHGLSKENNRSALRLNALSCVALPTCGLALAESERDLPSILEKFETVLDESGLRDDAISLRITGCPNGCARPYLAEIGFVGKAPGKYALYLGAKYNGTRLNRLFSPSITIDEAVTRLAPIIRRFAKERVNGEGFGDFCDREILPTDATFHSIGTPISA